MKTLHVHVWSGNEDDVEPIEEVDLSLNDEYDDHWQFGGMVQGKYLEVRLWKAEFVEVEETT
jgi:hypothetical protein